jgi:hypothetical protein
MRGYGRDRQRQHQHGRTVVMILNITYGDDRVGPMSVLRTPGKCRLRALALRGASTLDASRLSETKATRV